VQFVCNFLNGAFSTIVDFCQGLLSEFVRIQFLGRMHFFSTLKGSKNFRVESPEGTDPQAGTIKHRTCPTQKLLQRLCYSLIWCVQIKPRVEKMYYLRRSGPCPRLIFSRGHGPLPTVLVLSENRSKVASRSISLKQENGEHFVLSAQFTANKRPTTSAILLCWL
jgi:hypothetical protein